MGLVRNHHRHRLSDSSSPIRGVSPVSNSHHEERILVSIRLRPLNEKEIAHNEVADWECINNTTLMFNNGHSERQNSPTAYTFDRVFGHDCSTRQVYEEGAKNVALSVVSGINSSVFAYGQTSSGKTYTMSGVTEYTISDIYDYTDKNTSRKFVLKFSAMEIYNEAVRDLLSSDGTPLRLLDDPERGTVVEKLTEVTLRDRSHLRELLSVCAAQRKVGETALNEVSSRSHQILRLTVESSPREYNRFENSKNLSATVNFIDLAGSERASQTMSAGTRLKEGSHINRSLLTLGTVIRKLSKSRNGHVPYRDSKLTRILQNSLGGNARTAIICTMSPAHVHVEQSRNTLLFATCAKQVSTNAHVNVMMSEKTLIKQLQREIARLEEQLKNLGSLSSTDDSFVLKEKELVIEKMEKEIRELTQQRDQAHFRLQNFVSSPEEIHRGPRSWDEQSSVSEPNQEKLSWFEDYSPSEASDTVTDPNFRFDSASSISHFSGSGEEGLLRQNKHEEPGSGEESLLNQNKQDEQFLELSEEQFFSNETSPRLFMEKYFGPDPTKGWEKTAQNTNTNEDTCKEVQCIEINTNIKRRMSLDGVSSSQRNEDNQENVEIHRDGSEHPQPSPNSSEQRRIPRSKSSSAVITTTTVPKEEDDPSIEFHDSLEPSSPLAVENAKEGETTPSIAKEAADPDTPRVVIQESLASKIHLREHSHSVESLDSDSIDDKEHIIEVKSEKQFKNDLLRIPPLPDAEAINPSKIEQDLAPVSPSTWAKEFEKQRAEIIKLWDICHIPLVHRSYFFLVFKGDPSDAIYMEVELRRLAYLRESKGKNDQSLKEMNRERQMLSRLMHKKLSAKEREELFQKWGIVLKTKRRRHQLCRMLWTDTNDMEHIRESAAIVAKLVGLTEPGQVPKEMVGLSFSAPQVSASVRSFSWKPSLPSLM